MQLKTAFLKMVFCNFSHPRLILDGLLLKSAVFYGVSGVQRMQYISICSIYSLDVDSIFGCRKGTRSYFKGERQGEALRYLIKQTTKSSLIQHRGMSARVTSRSTISWQSQSTTRSNEPQRTTFVVETWDGHIYHVAEEGRYVND